MKVYIDKIHQVRVMVNLLAAYEANNAGDRKLTYDHLRKLLNMLDISDEARKEAYRQHKEACDRGDFSLKGKIEQLKADILAKLEPAETATPPFATESQPEAQLHPGEEDVTLKLPTVKMRKAVARFDSMADGEQIASLKEMWG